MPRSVVSAPRLLDHPGQQCAIGIVERGRAQRHAGFDQLVAGREQRDANAAADRQLGQAQSRGERDIGNRQNAAGRQHHRTDAHIFAGQAAIGAALQARRHNDGAIFGPHIFLHEHGVGVIRHRRAGEDADRGVRG